MSKSLTNQLANLWLNVTNGLRLAFFQKSALSRFVVNTDQIVLLAIVNLVLFIAIDYFKYTPDPTFNHYAFGGFSQFILCVLCVAFILAKLTGNHSLIATFFIELMSMTPFYYAARPVMSHLLPPPYAHYGIRLWVVLVVSIVLFHHVGKNIKKRFAAIGAYSLLLVVPPYFLSLGDFWYPHYDGDAYEKAYNSINQEKLFYAQQTYLNDIRSSLLPDRPGISDLYFVGFAGYAREDVFMKEIHYIQTLMDNKFDTRGRSVSLINNTKTMDSTPLATQSNLSLVLEQIGRKMNTEEDVLFLYLTSHGSRSHELSVSFWPLALNQIKPGDLKTALDQAGIKWRVLLISACYSGGFIEPLKNSNTLIMTAAAPDRTSFGCGSKSDFTYFGQEVFMNQLTHSYAFVTSFENAIDGITRREKAEHRKPSRPQLFVGTEINAKLDLLELELRKFYASSPAEYYTQ